MPKSKPSRSTRREPLAELTGLDLIRALRKAGFEPIRQSGSHVVLRHTGDATRRATVPVHKGRTIPRGTLQAILRGARLTVDELRALL